MSAVVFLDVETAGLDPRKDEVWEFAAIRREENGTETRHHTFVQHAEWRRAHLPETFRADLDRRYDPGAALGLAPFCTLLREVVFVGKPRIVGAAPWFDAAMLAEYVGQLWSHRLIDVQTLAAGHAGRLFDGLSDAAREYGIENPAAHTAMGDAETALALFDAVMGAER